MQEIVLSRESVEELATEIVEKLFEAVDGAVQESDASTVILTDFYKQALKRKVAEERDADRTRRLTALTRSGPSLKDLDEHRAFSKTQDRIVCPNPDCRYDNSPGLSKCCMCNTPLSAKEAK